MRRFRLVVAVVACLYATVLFTLPGFAETSPSSKCSSLALPRIINRVDENALMSLQGNLHHLARAQYDQGKVDDSLPLEHIILMLRRSPEQESALTTRIDQMHNRRSPYYHQWLKAQDVGKCYGVADSDIAVVTAWLQSHGFKIDTVPAGKMLILFSGTAGQVRNTFHTEIHNLNVRGEQHIANMSEPQIPAALAPVITGFRSLHNFFSKPAIRSIGTVKRDPKTGTWQPLEAGDRFLWKKPQPNGQGGNPDVTFPNGGTTYYAVGPQDLYTIYDETPLLSATPTPINGAGQTLAVVERTTITHSDVATFRSAFGLPTYPATPNATHGGVNFMDGIIGYCSDPGVSSSDVGEASLDVEWIGVTAPAATIDFVGCGASNTTDGIDLSLEYAIDDLADTVSAISSSYGGCEADGGSALEAMYSTLFEQAVAEGQTVVVAAGDSGSDACDRGDGDGPNSGQDLGETGISVQTQSSTQYAVAAGGSDFSDSYQTDSNPTAYWNPTNGTGLSSALSYIPEMAWNVTCSDALILDWVGYHFGITYGTGALGLCNDATNFNEAYPFTTLGGGTGGVSAYTALPTWQSVYGVGLNGNFTSITHRNLPDISMYAAIGTPWLHFLLYCVSSIGPCDYSNGSDAFAQGVGGTSAVAPMLTGIIALINEANPSGNGQATRQGQADYTFYALAGAEYGTPGSPNTSTSAPSLYTCEGSNINAITKYSNSNVFQTCNFNNINRTSQFGSTSCVDGTNTGCLVDNNGGACAAGSPDCYTGTTGDTYGILSLSTITFESGFNQSAGYNAATGLGSVNITNLVANWTSVTPQFASTTTFSLSPSPLYTTDTADLTATVTATGRGSIAPPLGTVSFYAGTACTGTAFASANLVPASNCTTSCNATASPSGVIGAQIGAGTTSVAACFSGDGANDAISSSTASVTLTQTVLTVSATPASLTIVGGQSGTVTLAVSANTAISTPVTFTCAGLPSDATCKFTSVTSLPSSTNVTMTITTTTSDAKLIRPAHGSSGLLLAFVLPSILLLPAGAATIRRRKNWLWCGLALLLMLGWLGCGGGSSSTPPPPPPPSGSQTYSVTATGAATGATSGTTGTIQVTVN
jgi:subtilase family serine protease